MTTGYLRRNTNHHKCEEAVKPNFQAEVGQVLDVDTVILNIRRGQYKYYVRGGFSRAKRMVLSPIKVALLCNLDLKQCLFEVKDQRIEGAVFQAGLTVMTVNSVRTARQPATILGWTASAF